MTKNELVRRHDAMMDAYRNFQASIVEGMDEVAKTLGKGEYALACRQLSAISQQHARTSVDLRKTLIRYGFLARESEDE